MSRVYDAIIIGLGTMGSQLLLQLAGQGWRVLGIDSKQPPHETGSHHGWSRLIRFAYFEHPAYVPLLLEAAEGWRALEQASGRKLFEACGVLQAGPAESELIRGIQASAAEHRLSIETWNHSQVDSTPFRLPKDWTVLWEPDAGFLHPEACVQAALEQAALQGAELRFDRAVTDLTSTLDVMNAGAPAAADGRLQVHAGGETYEAKQVAITTGFRAGFWRDWGVASPRVLGKHLFWFQPTSNHDSKEAWRLASGRSAFLFDTGKHLIYGFPCFDDQGVKIARHDGGYEVGTESDDSELGRVEELTSVQEFIKQFTVGLNPHPSRTAFCRYAMSADSNFRLGVSSRHPGITWASCFSGHGFKFAPAIAAHLAHRMTQGTWRGEVEFLIDN